MASILCLEKVTKAYPGVIALDQFEGEVPAPGAEIEVVAFVEATP